MTPKFAILASEEDAALAGLPDAGDPAGADVVFALGDEPFPDGAGQRRCARFLEGTAEEEQPVRTIAQAGPGAWRRAPWPAGDDLFRLPPAPAGGALVVSESDERRELLVRLISERGLPAAAAPRLTLDSLRQAALVVFPTAPGEALPALAPAVLAARRLLVTGPCSPSFGLIPEVDWFAADDRGDLAQYTDTMLRHPQAFRTARALGARAAERHRASTLYARLAVDLELEG